MKRSNRHILAKVIRVVARVVGVSTIAILISLAFIWSERADDFTLAKIWLSGNNYLSDEEVLGLLKLPEQTKLSDLDLTAIQDELERHPHIRAVRVSRNFPSAIRIDVIERLPLAYVNHSPFFLVDRDGVVLPTKDGNLEFDVPTLSGFNPASELYPVGERCLSQKVIEAVTYLDLMKREFPDLYEDLSEIMVDPSDEYVLCLSHYPTKIYLGPTISYRHLKLLEQFAHTISGVRSLHDYRYVDLRYNNQIIVKEKPRG